MALVVSRTACIFFGTRVSILVVSQAGISYKGTSGTINPEEKRKLPILKIKSPRIWPAY
jgi:hypothetical protein